MFRKSVTAMAVAALGVAGAAQAVTVVPTSLESITLGVLVAGPLATDFLDGLTDRGDSIAWVYNNGGVYSYVMSVDPDLANVSEYNLGFKAKGFNGVAGYSFDDAWDAGAKPANGSSPATAFDIDYEADQTIDWETNWMQGGSSGWDASDPAIRFFFQSTLAPGAVGQTNLIDTFTPSAQAYRPSAPEPSILLLMGTGLLSFRLIRRRKQ